MNPVEEEMERLWNEAKRYLRLFADFKKDQGYCAAANCRCRALEGKTLCGPHATRNKRHVEKHRIRKATRPKPPTE